MSSIVVAMAALTGGLAIQLTYLKIRQRELRRKSQAFRFHEIRDRLQLLVLEGKISAGSRAYEFMMPMLNLCIRNAGTMKFSDVFALAVHAEHEVARLHWAQLRQDIEAHDKEVQELSADFFRALGLMLTENDSLTMVMATVIAGIVRACGKEFARALIPPRMSHARRLRAIKLARKYQDWGNNLSPCQA